VRRRSEREALVDPPPVIRATRKWVKGGQVSASEEIDRSIRALHALKRKVAELESRRPIVDPQDVAAAKDDPNPFIRIFGRKRGAYFRAELARIHDAVERISAELKRLQD
jgi:hypothetical protein